MLISELLYSVAIVWPVSPGGSHVSPSPVATPDQTRPNYPRLSRARPDLHRDRAQPGQTTGRESPGTHHRRPARSSVAVGRQGPSSTLYTITHRGSQVTHFLNYVSLCIFFLFLFSFCHGLVMHGVEMHQSDKNPSPTTLYSVQFQPQSTSRLFFSFRFTVSDLHYIYRH